MAEFVRLIFLAAPKLVSFLRTAVADIGGEVEVASPTSLLANCALPTSKLLHVLLKQDHVFQSYRIKLIDPGNFAILLYPLVNV